MAVWGVKYRLGLINEGWEKDLYAVIGNELKKNDGVVPIKIGGYKDHVHVLFSTTGKIGEEEIIRRVKSESSRWVNKMKLTMGRFGWQDGNGRFSYSFRQLPAVIQYIENQKAHHRVMTFREEYQKWLDELGLGYDKFDMPEEPQ